MNEEELKAYAKGDPQLLEKLKLAQQKQEFEDDKKPKGQKRQTFPKAIVGVHGNHKSATEAGKLKDKYGGYY